MKSKNDNVALYISLISLFASIFALGYLSLDYYRSLDFKRYDNFIHYNKVYDDWYDKMPKKIAKDEKTTFASLTPDDRVWVKRYFDLYSQEYYLYDKKMFPSEVWNGLIHGCKNGKDRAAFRNFKKYPALLQGYACLKKEEGAIGFPDDFISMLDQELEKCKINIPYVKHCC